MYCPSCEHRLESGVERCDLCGFHLGMLDARFGNQDVAMEQITDLTHFLRTPDKDTVQEAIDEFETQFPQFFPAFFIGQLQAETRLSEFASWLLNRGRVSVLGDLRNSENVFLFVIDLTSRSVTVSAGYFAEQYVSEKDLRELLRDAVPFLIAGDLCEALEKLVEDLRLVLKRNHRLLRKHLKVIEAKSSKLKKPQTPTASEAGDSAPPKDKALEEVAASSQTPQ